MLPVNYQSQQPNQSFSLISTLRSVSLWQALLFILFGFGKIASSSGQAVYNQVHGEICDWHVTSPEVLAISSFLVGGSAGIVTSFSGVPSIWKFINLFNRQSGNITSLEVFSKKEWIVIYCVQTIGFFSAMSAGFAAALGASHSNPLNWFETPGDEFCNDAHKESSSLAIAYAFLVGFSSLIYFHFYKIYNEDYALGNTKKFLIQLRQLREKNGVSFPNALYQFLIYNCNTSGTIQAALTTLLCVTSGLFTTQHSLNHFFSKIFSETTRDVINYLLVIPSIVTTLFAYIPRQMSNSSVRHLLALASLQSLLNPTLLPILIDTLNAGWGNLVYTIELQQRHLHLEPAELFQDKKYILLLLTLFIPGISFLNGIWSRFWNQGLDTLNNSKKLLGALGIGFFRTASNVDDENTPLLPSSNNPAPSTPLNVNLATWDFPYDTFVERRRANSLPGGAGLDIITTKASTSGQPLALNGQIKDNPLICTKSTNINTPSG